MPPYEVLNVASAPLLVPLELVVEILKWYSVFERDGEATTPVRLFPR
jgi:hypothetical protein